MQGLRIFELLAFAAPKVSHSSFLIFHFSADFRGPPQVYLGCKTGCKSLKTPVFTAEVTLLSLLSFLSFHFILFNAPAAVSLSPCLLAEVRKTAAPLLVTSGGAGSCRMREILITNLFLLQVLGAEHQQVVDVLDPVGVEVVLSYVLQADGTDFSLVLI